MYEAVDNLDVDDFNDPLTTEDLDMGSKSSVSLSMDDDEDRLMDDADLLDELKDSVGETWSDDPVRMYLTQMGEIPLLTRQQEIALAKQIEPVCVHFARLAL